MKKTFITLLACTALGAAYGVENTEKGFGLEVNAAYNFALKDIVTAGDDEPGFKVNTYGIDLTAMYTVDKRNSFNVRFGWATGEEEKSLPGLYERLDGQGGPFSLTEKVEVQNIYIMPGYRYTGAVNETLSLFGGVNVGVAQVKGKGTVSGGGISESINVDKWGFAWSVELGVKQQVTENGHITLALQLQGMDATPKYEGEKIGERQINLGLRLGYSAQF